MLRTLRINIAIFGLLLALVGMLPFTTAAFADEEPVRLYYEPKNNPVADRTVHLNVNKLDYNSHDYVKGARLQIIDKETKEVVVEWVSGEKTAEIDRELDVDRTYILREVEAPDGWEKAEDVEFKLRSVNFETKGEVLSGAETKDGKTNAEFNNVSGDIETQAFVISLYDNQEVVERTETRTEVRPNQNNVSNERHTSNNQTNSRTETVTREETRNREVTEDDVDEVTETNTTNNVVTTQNNVTRDNVVVRDNNDVDTVDRTVTGYTENTTAYAANTPQRGGGTLTQTGDNTSYVPIIVAGVVGVVVIGAAIYLRRRG